MLNREWRNERVRFRHLKSSRCGGFVGKGKEKNKTHEKLQEVFFFVHVFLIYGTVVILLHSDYLS